MSRTGQKNPGTPEQLQPSAATENRFVSLEKLLAEITNIDATQDSLGSALDDCLSLWDQNEVLAHLQAHIDKLMDAIQDDRLPVDNLYALVFLATDVETETCDIERLQPFLAAEVLNPKRVSLIEFLCSKQGFDWMPHWGVTDESPEFMQAITHLGQTASSVTEATIKLFAVLSVVATDEVKDKFLDEKSLRIDSNSSEALFQAKLLLIDSIKSDMMRAKKLNALAISLTKQVPVYSTYRKDNTSSKTADRLQAILSRIDAFDKDSLERKQLLVNPILFDKLSKQYLADNATDAEKKLLVKLHQLGYRCSESRLNNLANYYDSKLCRNDSNYDGAEFLGGLGFLCAIASLPFILIAAISAELVLPAIVLGGLAGVLFAAAFAMLTIAWDKTSRNTYRVKNFESQELPALGEQLEAKELGFDNIEQMEQAKLDTQRVYNQVFMQKPRQQKAPGTVYYLESELNAEIRPEALEVGVPFTPASQADVFTKSTSDMPMAYGEVVQGQPEPSAPSYDRL